MSGALPLLPLYVFKVCKGTNLPVRLLVGFEHGIGPAFRELLGEDCCTSIVIFFHILYSFTFLQVHAMAQLVEALRYKAEVRGFDSRWCLWNFSLT